MELKSIDTVFLDNKVTSVIITNPVQIIKFVNVITKVVLKKYFRSFPGTARLLQLVLSLQLLRKNIVGIARPHS